MECVLSIILLKFLAADYSCIYVTVLQREYNMLPLKEH